MPCEEKLLQNSMIYNYDNLDLPESVNNILQQDFWVLESVNDVVLRAVSDPVKFSATSSIFIRRGECRAEISLAEHHIVAPAVVNIRTDQILTPTFISKDFDAIPFYQLLQGRPLLILHQRDKRRHNRQFLSNQNRIFLCPENTY